MKKIIYSLAVTMLLTAGTVATSCSPPSNKTSKTNENVEAPKGNVEEAQQDSPATNEQNEAAASQQKDVIYTQITPDQLPQGVSNALAKDYAGFKPDNAYQGNDGTYKVAVSKGADKSVLFFSGSGELIKSEKAPDIANPAN